VKESVNRSPYPSEATALCRVQPEQTDRDSGDRVEKIGCERERKEEEWHHYLVRQCWAASSIQFEEPTQGDPSISQLADSCASLAGVLANGLLHLFAVLQKEVLRARRWRGLLCGHPPLRRSGSAPPNGSRLSCGALKKDSFPNLRAPPASSAC